MRELVEMQGILCFALYKAGMDHAAKQAQRVPVNPGNHYSCLSRLTRTLEPNLRMRWAQSGLARGSQVARAMVVNQTLALAVTMAQAQNRPQLAELVRLLKENDDG